MSTNSTLLVIAALIPAVALCVYVYAKDRVEKEPIGLLLALFFAGVFIAFPVVRAEDGLSALLNRSFAPLVIEAEGERYLSAVSYYLYLACKNFFGIALAEEGGKFLVMYFITRRNRNFNSLFDGIVYAVFVSLGFAALENVFYVFTYGWGAAIARAVLSVPGHMFFAVFMGYYYSIWHIYSKANQTVAALKMQGPLDFRAEEFPSRKYLALSLILPACIHGYYDFCLDVNSWLSTLMFYALTIFLYVFCFKRIRRASAGDALESTITKNLIVRSFPQLAPVLDPAPRDDLFAPVTEK